MICKTGLDGHEEAYNFGTFVFSANVLETSGIILERKCLCLFAPRHPSTVGARHVLHVNDNTARMFLV